MRLRVFPNSQVYVYMENVELMIDDDNNKILPIDTRYVDMNSIQTNGNFALYKIKKAIVSKDKLTYEGILKAYDDYNAVLGEFSNKSRENIIRDYDTIQVEEQIIVDTSLNKINLSYITTGIDVNIQHIIYIDENKYELNCIITNNTSTSFDNALLEIMTSDLNERPLYRSYAMEGVSSSPAAIENTTNAGTIFEIDGEQDIPAGYEIIIPILDETIDIYEYYIINAAIGNAKADYTIEFNSPTAIPSGKMYIYRNHMLESITSMDSRGKDENTKLTLNRVQSIYTIGNVIIDKVVKEQTLLRENVQLSGDLYNKLPMAADVYLEYYVGTNPVSINVPRENDRIYFKYKMNPNSKINYKQLFTINHS